MFLYSLVVHSTVWYIDFDVNKLHCFMAIFYADEVISLSCFFPLMIDTNKYTEDKKNSKICIELQMQSGCIRLVWIGGHTSCRVKSTFGNSICLHVHCSLVFTCDISVRTSKDKRKHNRPSDTIILIVSFNFGRICFALFSCLCFCRKWKRRFKACFKRRTSHEPNAFKTKMR